MAQGLGAKVGNLLYASNQVPERVVPAAMMRVMAAPPPAPMDKALKPLAISPNRITRSATVSAVFAIE